MYIYKIINKINNKIYIGKSTDTRNHKKLTYYGSGLLIGRAIKKYGIENFDKQIIEECETNEELCNREKYWISHFNSTNIDIGYNISPGGDGGNTLSNHPNCDLIKQKISNVMKGRIFTETHKDNLKKNHPSKNEEYRLKLSKSLKGKPKSESHKKNLSKSIKRLYDDGFKSSMQTDNPMVKYDYVWITNKSTGENKRIVKGFDLPNGFVFGRSPLKKTYVNCNKCNRSMVSTSIKRHERVCIGNIMDNNI